MAKTAKDLKIIQEILFGSEIKKINTNTENEFSKIYDLISEVETDLNATLVSLSDSSSLNIEALTNKTSKNFEDLKNSIDKMKLTQKEMMSKINKDLNNHKREIQKNLSKQYVSKKELSMMFQNFAGSFVSNIGQQVSSKTKKNNLSN